MAHIIKLSLHECRYVSLLRMGEVKEINGIVIIKFGILSRWNRKLIR